jgi:DNA modification methylase
MLINGNCLEEMKNIKDNSVDLIFCDLPYGQTSCKWDCCIDLNLFWKEIMRIKILNAPIIMTTTTKFGVSLIQSAPKKCPFRYDLVWCKSASCGFLSSSKQPLRKHEMIYVFYEKLPFYDLSSHKHKFIKERDTQQKNGNIYEGDGNNKKIMEGKYDPPLPTSLIKEEKMNSELYGELPTTDSYGEKIGINKSDRSGKPRYDPPLPTSLIKEEKHDWVIPQNTELYGKAPTENNVKLGGHQKRYDPPLPNSLLEIKSTRGKHSTEKPVQLMEWVLKYYSKEGDTVLDPTMGSGSTGVACKNMNRKFIGIEMDKDIYDGAVKRLE